MQSSRSNEGDLSKGEAGIERVGESMECFSIENEGCASEAKSRRVGGPPRVRRRVSECQRHSSSIPWKKPEGVAGRAKIKEFQRRKDRRDRWRHEGKY